MNDEKKVNEEKIDKEKAGEPKEELQKVNNLKVESEVLVDSASEQQRIFTPTPKQRKES